MGLTVGGKKKPKKWSAVLGGDPKIVEHAALDLFKNRGWCATRDTSMLIELMLKLQLITCNELPRSVVGTILGIRCFNKWLIETRPIASNFDKSYGWLTADIGKQIINVFPNLQDEFTERDLILTIMKSISGPFKGLRHYKDKIEEFVYSLELSRSTKVDLSFQAFLHYSEFRDKDFKENNVMYHCGMGVNFDLVPMFDNINPISREKMEVALLKYLPTFFEKWQKIKIAEMKFGYKRRPLPKKISEIKKLPEISKESFYGYCVHGAKNAEETVSGLMKLYTTFPETIWLDLVKSQSYRPEGFFYDAGIPDLLIWNGNDYAFVEIKSPNDRLQKSQLDYFENILEKLSLNYYVANVVDLSPGSTRSTK